ncbi:MAG: hypothetical protein M3Y89_17075, partial [Actinomycetota bacterium]|nr:hypothetical protein [Actinomycetota bacterium]
LALSGEDRTAAAVGALLSRDGLGSRPAQLAAALAARGIGWVVVEAGTPGPALPDLSGLQPVTRGAAVSLYRVPGPIEEIRHSTLRRWLVIGGDLLVALLIAVAVCLKAGFAGRRLLHSPVTSVARFRPEDE